MSPTCQKSVSRTQKVPNLNKCERRDKVGTIFLGELFEVWPYAFFTFLLWRHWSTEINTYFDIDFNSGAWSNTVLSKKLYCQGTLFFPHLPYTRTVPNDGNSLIFLKWIFLLSSFVFFISVWIEVRMKVIWLVLKEHGPSLCIVFC
jgi:hypothetical protein